MELAAPTEALPRYHFQVTLDYDRHHLDVHQRLDYINSTGDTLHDIAFNVHPNYSPGIFTLHGLSLETDRSVSSPKYTLESTALRVDLSRPLAPGEEIALLFDFSLDPPQIDPKLWPPSGNLGWSERATALGNWYIALAPYHQGQGWYTFPYHPVGDPYVTEVANYDVEITAPEGVIVVGSGDMEKQGDSWHYRIAWARSFAFIASQEYQWAQSTADSVTVTSYYFPEHEAAGQKALETAAWGLSLFGDLYGPYPYATYSVCEASLFGGMEYPTLTFLGSCFYDSYDGRPLSLLIALSAHELAHQWWYGVVGNDQVREPWLDESLAQYSELLFFEHVYPEGVKWWWENRIHKWHPSGPVDVSIYNFSETKEYICNMYGRAVLFMDDLRRLIGGEAFFAFLKDYYHTQAYKLSTAEDFFTILSQHSDADLSPLLEEYFNTPPSARDQ